MRLQAAVLCDYAQVREGVLFVSSGGLARAVSPGGAPRPLGMMLALVLEIGPEEIEAVHEVRVTVLWAGGGEEIGQATLGFQAPPQPQLQPGEAMVVPLVIPIQGIMITHMGPHDVRVTVDGEPPTILTVYAVDAPLGGVVPPTA